mmetsp:Transcript_7548/g.13445  ORF Transcript_7548/g.13445 Transcript_7548/m.13445 type:complete len:292 (+) Transcript_7548:95-970(+)|eukprot:CAMPEP_0171546372 /NCGR_PEP_ID=MMETSP0960-20121227/4593_1 /TAXON_ID=87120 /ORGANISM="Aurantiochytrium limacinum, Strain ATCCMYA-1381" /LENGTH=291 /DNA_ID=CAMNT_0012094431 /DNA_START=1 /DNA_END=876 /DNA_ORIENTATION=-
MTSQHLGSGDGGDSGYRFGATIIFAMLVLLAIVVAYRTWTDNYSDLASPTSIISVSAEPQNLTRDQVKEGEEVSIGKNVVEAGGTKAVSLVRKSMGEAKSGKARLLKKTADLDDQGYFVAAGVPGDEQAANHLAELQRRAMILIARIDDLVKEGKPLNSVDGREVTENMKRILKKHLNRPLLLVELFQPGGTTVGANSGKGMLFELCLRKNANDFDPVNSTMRVLVHEIAHSGDANYRKAGVDAHGPVFKSIQDFMLEVAEREGLYSCEEFSNGGRRICGLQLDENDSAFC